MLGNARPATPRAEEDFIRAHCRSCRDYSASKDVFPALPRLGFSPTATPPQPRKLSPRRRALHCTNAPSRRRPSGYGSAPTVELQPKQWARAARPHSGCPRCGERGGFLKDPRAPRRSGSRERSDRSLESRRSQILASPNPPRSCRRLWNIVVTARNGQTLASDRKSAL